MSAIARRVAVFAASAALAIAVAAGPAAATPPEGDDDALEKLADQLMETDAVGVLDKLSVQSRVDTLAQAFHHYHEGRSGLTLSDLRSRFDTLHGRIVDMLSEDDASLAGKVRDARPQLWRAFADPERFRNGIGEELGHSSDQVANGFGF